MEVLHLDNGSLQLVQKQILESWKSICYLVGEKFVLLKLKETWFRAKRVENIASINGNVLMLNINVFWRNGMKERAILLWCKAQALNRKGACRMKVATNQNIYLENSKDKPPALQWRRAGSCPLRQWLGLDLLETGNSVIHLQISIRYLILCPPLLPAKARTHRYPSS